MKVTRLQFELTDIRVIDSDTVEAWVQVSFEIRQRWRIRIRGVEGGELGTDQGLAGQFALQTLLLDYVVDRPHYVGLESVKDQFGRHVGDIRLPDGQLLSLRLLAGKTHWRRDRDGTEHPRKDTYEKIP